MRTIHKVWLSTDTHYYAVQATGGTSSVAYDVLEVAGPGVWLFPRYRPDVWGDTDVRYCYAEFPGMISVWSNLGRWTRHRTRYIDAFRIEFVDIRQDVQFHPLSRRMDVNPILGHYTATFLRQQRIAAAQWHEIQQRITQGIADGYATLARLTGQPVPGAIPGGAAPTPSAATN